jgi:hypothetical protein
MNPRVLWMAGGMLAAGLTGCPSGPGASGRPVDADAAAPASSARIPSTPAAPAPRGETAARSAAPTRPGCLAPAPPTPDHLRDVDAPSRERAELILRVHRDLPVRCNAAQTNTPCVYEAPAHCLLRRSNCTGQPCTEGDHLPIDCACDVKGLPAPKTACLVLTGIEPAAAIRIFHEDQFSEGGAGAEPDGRAKLCTETDRPFWIEVEDAHHGRTGFIVDWPAAACQTIDVGSRTLTPSCADPPPAKTFEGRF